MNLSVKGKLLRKLNIESGTSKSGNEWKKQSFILDTGNQYNPEICFQMFGEEKIEILNNFSEGNIIEVAFNLSSREYNGKYYHNIDAWKIETISEKEPMINEDLIAETESLSPEGDDLPF